MLWHDARGAPDLLAGRRARPRRRRAVARRAAPAAGSRAAREREGGVHRSARHVRRRLHERERRQGLADTFPASDPTTEQQPGGEPEPERRPSRAHGATLTKKSRAGARRGLRARARLGRDRGDHLVHEHVEPVGDDRRGPAREEGGREGPEAQAVGEVVARARLEGRDRVLRALRARRAISTSSASTPSATAARRASATPARCRSRSAKR